MQIFGSARLQDPNHIPFSHVTHNRCISKPIDKFFIDMAGCSFGPKVLVRSAVEDTKISSSLARLLVSHIAPIFISEYQAMYNTTFQKTKLVICGLTSVGFKEKPTVVAGAVLLGSSSHIHSHPFGMTVPTTIAYGTTVICLLVLKILSSFHYHSCW
jgi:hypothetical protein